MINAPAAYHNSMNRVGRNRSYTRVLISLTDVNAQATMSGQVGETDKVQPYSNLSGLLQSAEYKQAYATWEPHKFRLDGTPFLAPGESEADKYQYKFQGLVFAPLSNAEGLFDVEPQLILTWDSYHTIYGITIQFDSILDSIVSDLTIQSYRKGTPIEFHEIQGNDKARIEEVISFTNFDKLVITFKKTLHPYSRVQITYLLMGIGITFTNTELVTTVLTRKANLLAADIPTSTFSFTVDNTDGKFDLDNQDNIINFFQAKQPVTVMYGYEIEYGQEPYWMFGGRYLLTGEPSITDTDIQAEATSILDNMDSDYYKGIYRAEGTTLYDLAVDVFEDAKQYLPVGVELNYYIDSFLKTIKTVAPMPVVKHKECLQYIANAGMCTVSLSREGDILIQSAFIPKSTISDNDHMYYATSEKLLDEVIPEKSVVTWEPNFYTLQPGILLRPAEEDTPEYTGYVSSIVADATGSLAVEDGAKYPEITVVFEANFSAYNFKIFFDTLHNVYPTEIQVLKYTDNELSEEWIERPQGASFKFSKSVTTFNKLVLRFIKMSQPYSRLRITSIDLGNTTDYVMYRKNTMGSPTAEVQQDISSLSLAIPYFILGTEEDTLLSSEYIVSGTQTIHVSYGDAVYNQVATLGGTGIILKQEHYSYASDITIQTQTEQTVTLTVKGYHITKETTQTLFTQVNAIGSPEVIENPLITDRATALRVLQWNKEYILDNKVYVVPFRGDPVIDPLDLIYYQTRLGTQILTRVAECKLTSGQGISGELRLKGVSTDGSKMARTKN